MHRFSDLNKTKRAESVKKIALDKLKQVPLFKHHPLNRNPEISVKQLIDEIIRYLIDIIEALLQQENSQNYLNYIGISEKMYKELEKKMIAMIAEKSYEIKCEFIEKIDELEKAQRKTQIVQRDGNNKLKNQRRNITQNILNYHRTNSFKSFTHHRSQDVEKFGSENELPFQDEKIMEVGSIQLNSIQSKIAVIEDTHNQKMKEVLQKIQKKFDENSRDIKLITQKHIDFRLNFEQKLDSSLQSIWNVIGNTQGKICQLQMAIDKMTND